MTPVGDAKANRTEPYGTWHLTFWLIYLVIMVAITGVLWSLTNQILPASITLNKVPAGFSPFLYGRVSLDYAGFVTPFVVSMVIAAVLYRREVGGKRLSLGLVALLVIAPASFLLSQFTLVGALVSLGKTDVVMMGALIAVLYYNSLRLSTTDSILLAYPLGFILGFMSDLESAAYFTGVFGGYGFGDGDFLYPLAFALTAFVFSKLWGPAFSLFHRLDLKYEEGRARRRRKRPATPPKPQPNRTRPCTQLEGCVCGHVIV